MMSEKKNDCEHEKGKKRSYIDIDVCLLLLSSVSVAVELDRLQVGLQVAPVLSFGFLLN